MAETETRPRRLSHETETRPRCWQFFSRRDRDKTLVRLETVSRPRRQDRDHNPGNSTLLTIPTVKNLKFVKCKMAAAAILKSKKITISPPHFERFWRNLAQWCSLNLLTVSTIKNFKFQKSKMAAAAILKNRKITISRLRLNRFRRNLACWESPTFLTVGLVKIWNFKNPPLPPWKIKKSP